MHKHKRLSITVAVAALTLAGNVSAIPLSWTKTFTLTGTGVNIPATGTQTPGTLWLYAPSSNTNNQTTAVTLGSAGPVLTPTNPDNGNPVEYTLDSILIEGLSTSLIIATSGPAIGFGNDRLTDIRGTVERLAVGGGTTDFYPYEGVGLGCGTFPTANKIYNTADLSTGVWTGFCPGTFLTTTGFPDVNDFTSQIVTDATQFELFFWNETNQPGDEPEARLDGLTVSFIGTCTDNCKTGGGPGPTPTPVPATLALFGLGLAGLGGLRRRKGD